MTLLVWALVIGAVAALAFAAYYQFMLRALHIELRAREIHTIQTSDGWRIRLFRYRKGGSSGEPVLLVHGYTSNHWNLTLPQGESLADYLVEQGYDCWAIDLRSNRTSLPPPGTKHHKATYDGYVMGDLPAAIAFIRQSTGYDQVHWVGHSMGGMLLYAYELVHGREHVASGTTIASPPWLEANWTKLQDRLVKLMDAAPWPFEIGKRTATPLFAWRKPNSQFVPVNWKNLNPRFGVAEFFNATEQTAGPVTHTFEDCAKHRYLAVNNDTVNVLSGLSRLETPLLVMACPLDTIATPGNVQEFYDRLPSDDKRFLMLSREHGCEMDHSHVDPPFAKNAAAEVFAPILEWIGAHPAQQGTVEAAPKGSAVPASIIEEKLEPVPAPAAAHLAAPEQETSEDGTLWGKALKDAANILSGLEVKHNGADEAPAKNRPSARKPSTKSRVSKAAAAKKSSTKKKISTKAKKSASNTAAKTAKPASAAKSPKNSAASNGVTHTSAKPKKISTKAKAGRNKPSAE